ncbi:MAG: Zn-dependent membrane protease YugP [Bacteroidia bacterium]|jgi:Zn-dependent membrane protease YugP
MGYSGLMILGIVFAAIGGLVSARLRSKFKKYSNTPLQNGYSGKEVAEKMLRDNGIYDVQVISVQGQLTDHYNPVNKTVNLSEGVYSQRNAAAAAVAAHECGHAVQHAKAYFWLGMRSKLVPLVQFSSSIVHWVLLIGILTINIFPKLLLVGIILFAATALFTVVTLPVEFDASRRALAWMKSSNTVNNQEYVMSKDALKWAALTYVVAALNAVATLMYVVSMYTRR